MMAVSSENGGHAAEVDRVRAVVVKLSEDGYEPERAWVACTMSQDTYEIIGEDDWQRWKHKALDLCLADWQNYEIREVVLNVPQAKLEEMFAVESIDVEVGGDES